MKAAPIVEVVVNSVMSREAYEVWRKGVLSFSRGLAERSFRRLAEFQAESSLPEFPSISAHYERVLWQFVMDQTPDSLLEKINQVRIARADFSEAQNCHVTQYYLLRRAVFLTGLNYGKAHESEWYRDFADEFAVAARLDDRAVFEALAGTKQKRRKKENAPNWGMVRFYLLLAWVAGGLWKLPNDAERAAQVNIFWGLGKADRVTEAGLCKAKQKLRLNQWSRC